MRHLSQVTRPLPRRASVKGDQIEKDCTPKKETFGLCQDDPQL
jgi:hypothetical protein